ncbi:MAG: hypothetical protein ACK559_41995, partial [bacterium]
MHRHVSCACGGNRCLLYGFILAGREEVHGHTRSTIQIPVGSRYAAGGGRQADPVMGLVKSAFRSGHPRSRMALGAYRRATLQRASGTNDRSAETLLGA